MDHIEKHKTQITYDIYCIQFGWEICETVHKFSIFYTNQLAGPPLITYTNHKPQKWHLSSDCFLIKPTWCDLWFVICDFWFVFLIYIHQWKTICDLWFVSFSIYEIAYTNMWQLAWICFCNLWFAICDLRIVICVFYMLHYSYIELGYIFNGWWYFIS